MTEYQLRIYKIKPGEMDDWMAEWSARVVPLRRAHGFEIPLALRGREDNRFIWLLVYPGSGTFAEADAAYYASRERHALDPDPARHIASGEQWMLERVDIDTDRRP